MIFDCQPTIIGKLIRLRPLLKDDFDELYAAASDPAIWEQHPENDRYQLPVFTAFFESALASGGALVIIDLKTDNIIGSSRFYDLESNRQITIGYTFLATKYWGGTYNRELKNMMLSYAFRFVPNVAFEVGERNFRSRRAIEKIGAKLKGVVDAKVETLVQSKVIYVAHSGDGAWVPGLEISAQKNRLDLNVIHQFLANSYWAMGRSREIVAKCIAGSFCLGAYDSGDQVGFIRAVTDGALFGYIFDVFVLESHRAQGVGKALVSSLLEQPGFDDIRWMLRTDNAGGLYERFGFRKFSSLDGIYIRTKILSKS